MKRELVESENRVEQMKRVLEEEEEEKKREEKKMGELKREVGELKEEKKKWRIESEEQKEKEGRLREIGGREKKIRGSGRVVVEVITGRETGRGEEKKEGIVEGGGREREEMERLD